MLQADGMKEILLDVYAEVINPAHLGSTSFFILNNP